MQDYFNVSYFETNVDRGKFLHRRHQESTVAMLAT